MIILNVGSLLTVQQEPTASHLRAGFSSEGVASSHLCQMLLGLFLFVLDRSVPWLTILSHEQAMRRHKYVAAFAIRSSRRYLGPNFGALPWPVLLIRGAESLPNLQVHGRSHLSTQPFHLRPDQPQAALALQNCELCQIWRAFDRLLRFSMILWKALEKRIIVYRLWCGLNFLRLDECCTDVVKTEEFIFVSIILFRLMVFIFVDTATNFCIKSVTVVRTYK